METKDEPATLNLTEEQRQILALQKRVKTLEGQVLNCLKFMQYHAEKEADRLESILSVTRPTREKAKA